MHRILFSLSLSVCNSGNEHATYTSNIIPMKRMENTIARAKDRERDKDRRVNRARRDFNRLSFLHRDNLPFPYLVFGHRSIRLYYMIDFRLYYIIRIDYIGYSQNFFYTFFNRSFSGLFAISFDEKESKHE